MMGKLMVSKSKIKKYTSQDQSTPIEPQSKLTASKTRSSSRLMIPADQVIIIYGTTIMQFPVGNTTIIQGMIDRMSTITPSIPTYQKTVKNYVDYQAAIALVRDL
jgi:hypothetical protein